MRKSLFATAAAVALIAGAGFASAEGAKEQPGMRGGDSMKSEPQRSEPQMKQGADVKSGTQSRGKAETTGAGSEMKAEPKADVKGDSKANANADRANANKANGDKANADKAKPSTTGQGSEPRSGQGSRSGTDTKAGADMKTGTDTKAGADVKSGAGGSVNLTSDQRTKIRTTVIQSSNAPKVARSQINFNISVGTVVPRSVHFVTVPATLVEIHPEWRGYSYFIVDDEIVIVDARTMRIIAVFSV
jgi:hypothetical protein